MNEPDHRMPKSPNVERRSGFCFGKRNIFKKMVKKFEKILTTHFAAGINKLTARIAFG